MGLGDDEEPVRRVSCFYKGVVGPASSHALTRARSPGRDQSRGPSLRRGFGPRHRRYYDPLGLPSGAIPFRHRLIRIAFALEGQPVRVSPVPCRAVSTCPPPYPGSVLRRSITSRRSLLPSPRHDRLGRSTLSGFSLTGLQGFTLTHWARGLALPPGAIRPRSRTLDTPLGLGDLSPHLGSATRRDGAYRDGTFTRKFGTARPPRSEKGPRLRAGFRTRHARSVGDGRRRTPKGARETRRHVIAARLPARPLARSPARPLEGSPARRLSER